MSIAIDKVRLNTNEPADESDFDDDEIQAALTAAANNVNKASATIWRLKASRAADLVDASEGNSRRSWSKSHEQALRMAAEYQNLGDKESNPNSSRPTGVMHRITRS